MTVLQTAQAILDTDELLNNPDLTHDAHRRLENKLNNLGCDHGVEVSRALIRAVELLEAAMKDRDRYRSLEGASSALAERDELRAELGRAKERVRERLTQQARADDVARLQQKCSDWKAYWRASDAHGVKLTVEQSVELLQDALGVEVEIKPTTDAADWKAKAYEENAKCAGFIRGSNIISAKLAAAEAEMGRARAALERIANYRLATDPSVIRAMAEHATDALAAPRAERGGES